MACALGEKMLELKLSENGTGVSSYQSEDFKYNLLLNLECIGMSRSEGDRIRFSLSLIRPEHPNPIADAMEYILSKSILEEEGYQNAKASPQSEMSSQVEYFVKNHITRTLADIIAESVKQGGGRLLLSGPEKISNSYYAHRDIYVLPAISGVGIIDIRTGTCPGYFVRAFCSDEIDTKRRETIRNRVLKRFVQHR